MEDEGAQPVAGAAMAAGPALPLLKFDGPDERPVLCLNGLAAIEALPGPVCPVAFVGDGRSGKSYLASKLVGSNAFPQDDTDVAVTTGIDVAVRYTNPGHLIVFDCEGGNNALAQTRSIVTVVGALLATALVFVTDGKASESSIEALAHMLEERTLIKCDGTGSLHAQSLLFVVNQNRLRYSEDTLDRILSMQKDNEGTALRELISQTYPPERRSFHAVPEDSKQDFEERWSTLHEAIQQAAQPLKMGKLWMTGKQVVEMLRRIEVLLRKHGKVSLPSLHRHVILDSWLKPKVSQVLASGLHKLVEGTAPEEWANHQVGAVRGTCEQCKKADAVGWLDPDIEEFFCEDCWREFSPKVLKCGFCSAFQPWPLGRVEVVTKQWHCVDCLMQLGVDIVE